MKLLHWDSLFSRVTFTTRPCWDCPFCIKLFWSCTWYLFKVSGRWLSTQNFGKTLACMSDESLFELRAARNCLIDARQQRRICWRGISQLRTLFPKQKWPEAKPRNLKFFFLELILPLSNVCFCLCLDSSIKSLASSRRVGFTPVQLTVLSAFTSDSYLHKYRPVLKFEVETSPTGKQLFAFLESLCFCLQCQQESWSAPTFVLALRLKAKLFLSPPSCLRLH